MLVAGSYLASQFPLLILQTRALSSSYLLRTRFSYDRLLGIILLFVVR